MRLTVGATLGALIILTWVAESAGAASFMLLGGESDNFGGAEEVSADGSVVVGAGFRWSSNSGLEYLSSLAEGLSADSRVGLSADGSTIVGGLRDRSAGTQEAFRWSESRGLERLGGGYSRAQGVSADGSIAAGVRDISPFDSQAVRWDSNGQMHDLSTDDEALGRSSAARDISWDGSVIVGEMLTVDTLGATELDAFRWDKESGIQKLGVLPGRASSVAMAVSGDGSTIVGFSGDGFSPPRVAFRWDAINGMQSLGGIDSLALDVSADGSTTVGAGFLSDEEPREYIETALMWTAEGEMHDLNILLASLGVDLNGVRLVEATGVSADGRTIVGSASDGTGRRRPFVAVIPEPATALLMGLGLAGLAIRRGE